MGGSSVVVGMPLARTNRLPKPLTAARVSATVILRPVVLCILATPVMLSSKEGVPSGTETSCPSEIASPYTFRAVDQLTIVEGNQGFALIATTRGFAVFCDSVMNCLVVLESVSTEPPLAVVWKRRPGIVVSIWRQLIFIVLGLVTAMLARFIPG